MTLQLFDLLLRGQKQLSDLFADSEDLSPTIRRMLLVSIAGLLVHALAVSTAIHFLAEPRSFLSGGVPFLWMPVAFIAAFLGTLLICLPSFWFYTQLSGLDASFRLCTAQALRAQATTSVMLLGTLPIYFAIALSAALELFIGPSTAIFIGFALPFVVGLFGIRAVYRGFNDLLVKIPITHPRRGDFVRRMVLAWGALYTAIAPVALFRLAQTLSAL
jgi:hypothetical protein